MAEFKFNVGDFVQPKGTALARCVSEVEKCYRYFIPQSGRHVFRVFMRCQWESANGPEPDGRQYILRGVGPHGDFLMRHAYLWEDEIELVPQPVTATEGD